MQNKFVHEIPVLAVEGRTQMPVCFHCPVQCSKCTTPGSVAEGLSLAIFCAPLNLPLFHLLICHLIHLFSLSFKGECIYLPHY